MFANAIYATGEGRCSRRSLRPGRRLARDDGGRGACRRRARSPSPPRLRGRSGGFGRGGFPPGGPRGRGRKARRGDIRTAALLLLAEEPRNGYQIMQEVEERSDGVWRPSPGSVYPALQQLEDEGLIRSEEIDGRKLFALTDAGRRYVRGARRGRAGAVGADERRRQRRGARAGQLMREVGYAFVQVMRTGSEAQMAQAREVLATARARPLPHPRRRRRRGRLPWRTATEFSHATYMSGESSTVIPDGSDAEPAPDRAGAALRRGLRRRRCGRSVERPGQALRRGRSRARHRLRGRAQARRSASSAPTARASRRRSTCSARSCARPAGSALVAGHDVVRERDEVRRNIGLVFQDTTLDGYLTAEQNLRLHAELYGVPRDAGRRAHAAGDGDGRPVGAARQPGQHLLGRDEAAPGDRARPAALAARAVPRRADRRPRPADAQLDLGLHPRAQARGGHHDLPDHPLHGRGRVLRPHRDHGPGPDRRARHARGAEGERRQGPRPDPDRRRRGGDRRAARALRDRGG